MPDQENTAKAVSALEQTLIEGNLASLSQEQRMRYYKLLCESLGLNPLTRPFEYITFQGKVMLYARRDATDQLRKIHGVSISVTARERFDDVYVVSVHASMPDGRTDDAIGAINIINMKGTELANAMMKCETKAKRRVTLSIVGLGFSDELEIESMLELNGKQPMKALAPAKKLEDYPEDEQREILRKSWGEYTQKLQERGIVEYPPPFSFEEEPLSLLIEVTRMLREAARSEDTHRAWELLKQLNEKFDEPRMNETKES